MKLLKKAKDLWKQHPLMDTPQMAKELGITQQETLNLVHKFTTPQERSEREYRIAKDYHDSTGSWPEGYDPAFEEEADEAAQADKEEEPEQKLEQAAETEKATEEEYEEHSADMPEQEETKAEEVRPQKRPSPEQIIAACVMQIATQVDILRQEHEKFVNDTRQEFVKLTNEMSAAIKEAEENARTEERKRILSMIGEMK